VSDASDRDLERAFHDVREADRRRAPSFTRVMAGRSMVRRPHSLWPALATSVVVVAAVMVLRIMPRPSTPFEIRPGEMRVPTDYLLELVTVPRAGEIPRVGSVDWFPLESSTSNRREQ
jgi:hypothetical protein